MSTFSKLQRNISYKIYLDLLLAFLIVLLNSSFIYIPLFIGLFITINVRKTFLLPFLFFTEIMHNFAYFSLIGFYFIYKNYIYNVLQIQFTKLYANFLSIILVYILYFLLLSSYFTINDINIHFNYIYLVYFLNTN